jgi:hypothetical protein
LYTEGASMIDPIKATSMLNTHRHSYSNATVSDYAQHFGRFDWHHFVTATFARHVSAEAAEREVHNRFRRRLEQAAQCRVSYFGAVERGDLNERVHVHLVIYGTREMTPGEVEGQWIAGRSDARVFEGANGVWYAAKSLGAMDSHLLLWDRRLVE